MNSPNKKYRPSLSIPQLNTIIELAKNQSPMAPDTAEVLGVLIPYVAKINLAAVSPSYTMQAKKTPLDLLDELGGLEGSDYNQASNTAISKPHYWKECYDKYKNDPEPCTFPELEAVNEHRYLNNLMTPEEVTEFEKGNTLVGLNIVTIPTLPVIDKIGE